MSECADCGKILSDDERIVTLPNYTSFYRCKRCERYTQVLRTSNRSFTYSTMEDRIVEAILRNLK